MEARSYVRLQCLRNNDNMTMVYGTRCEECIKVPDLLDIVAPKLRYSLAGKHNFLQVVTCLE